MGWHLIVEKKRNLMKTHDLFPRACFAATRISSQIIKKKKKRKKKLLGIDRAKHSPDRGGAAGALAFGTSWKMHNSISSRISVSEEVERKVKREGRGERALVCRQQTAVSDSGGESAGNFGFFFPLERRQNDSQCAQQVRQLFNGLSREEIPGVIEEFRRNDDLDLGLTSGHLSYFYVLTSTPTTTTKKNTWVVFSCWHVLIKSDQVWKICDLTKGINTSPKLIQQSGVAQVPECSAGISDYLLYQTVTHVFFSLLLQGMGPE